MLKPIKNPKSFLFLFLFLAVSACTIMTEKVSDPSAGLNGSFEIVKDGLPVNWLMYTPNTVEDAEFEIILDQQEFKEGAQSLQFKVESVKDEGHGAPGFTNEFFDIGKFSGEATYRVSFWVKNEGTEFRISAGGVESKGGQMEVLVQTNETIEEWRKYEFDVNVPGEQWLRLHLKIVKPGTFWIDDVRIEKI